MSIYTNAQYIKNSLTGSIDTISINIDGVSWIVPICPGNTDYSNIMQLVESGDLTIKPAEESNNQ
jgi:hypothetical protein